MKPLADLRCFLPMLLLGMLCTSARAATLHVKVESTTGAPLAEAVVYLTPAVRVAPAGPLQARIDQIHKMFVPQVSVVQVGTAVSFPNSDNIRHSIYSFSPAKVFTLKLYSGTPSMPIVFDKTGVVALGCNIHDQMVAWILVINTPYMQQADKDGLVTLSNLPAGDYVLRAWHEPMSEEVPGQPVHLDSSGTMSRVVQLDLEAQSVAMAGM